MSTLEFTTEKLFEEKFINWNIKNFTHFQESKSPNNESTELTFTIGESLKQLSTWKFELKFTSTNEMGLYLYLQKIEKSEEKSVNSRYWASIKGPSSTLIVSRSAGMREYTTTNEGLGWVKFVTLDKLKATDALINDILTIQIRMVIYGEDIMVKGTTPDCTQKMLKEDTLKDFKQLLQTGEGSDFVIRVKEFNSNEYVEKKVHRTVLSARSPVFKTMLESEMSEKGTGIVTIEDLTPKGLDALLEFIYTGNLPDDWKLVPEEIVNAAEKYQFPLLKTFCDEWLHDACTTENAFTLLTLAKKHELCKASKNIFAYIKSNLENVLSDM